ncbi:FAD-binding protein [Acidaminobacter sp. JC074]|uniref:FAD-binding protein n=1 Tax=Acidaminobacter sp. JC074 TaxID=2530199 RepID=UPI001F0F6B91|nr:FAD-binding protein [Acidaminobacter sp. JC074]MCH4887509.1 FAD-binding protein [Acidaminobacter sp. JC074]
MKIKTNLTTDVLVVGAGLAGINAAIEASKADVDVMLVSSKKICSGSSFYPGTWGLGMVAPADKDDEKHFVDTITKVACKMNDRRLSEKLIENISSDIKGLEDIGVTFKRPENTKDQTLIPCFDNKHRNWYGYLFETAKPAFLREIKRQEIRKEEDTEVIHVEKNADSYIVYAIQNNHLIAITTKALVFATGGFGGLYKHRLNTSDITGAGQALAYKLGCKLINMEFMQFIPGFVSPAYKTIVNERAFKLATFIDENNQEIEVKKDIIEERSGHGPFTTRLESKSFDIELFKAYLSSNKDQCVRMVYKTNDMDAEGVMIRDYFKWLKENKNISPDEQIFILPFMHAANGGIKIDEDAKTSLKGIYAAGEVTGGMHGADRIGGLSTANALVFGKIAGKNAGIYAKTVPSQSFEIDNLSYSFYDDRHLPYDILSRIQELMYDHASVIRTEEGLRYAYDEILLMEKEMKKERASDIKRASIISHAVTLSKVILLSMIERKESRGSHFRLDYPSKSKDYDYIITSGMKVD